MRQRSRAGWRSVLLSVGYKWPGAISDSRQSSSPTRRAWRIFVSSLSSLVFAFF